VAAMPLEQRLNMTQSILPEVIVGCKEVSSKTKEAALALLLGLAESTAAQQSDTEHDDNDESATTLGDVTPFLEQVAAGLAGKSPHMIASTMLALGVLLHHFKGHIADKSKDNLLEVALLLLKSPSKEIVIEAVVFLRSAVSFLSQEQLQGILHRLVLIHSHSLSDSHSLIRSLESRQGLVGV